MVNTVKLKRSLGTLIGITLALILVLTPFTLFAHGPKGHGNMGITALEAAKKGIELYDRLLEGEKLDSTWEIALSDIKVFMRDRGNEEEIVVQFSRTEGNPRSVFIFFNQKGEYSGSNFSGE